VPISFYHNFEISPFSSSYYIYFYTFFFLPLTFIIVSRIHLTLWYSQSISILYLKFRFHLAFANPRLTAILSCILTLNAIVIDILTHSYNHIILAFIAHTWVSNFTTHSRKSRAHLLAVIQCLNFYTSYFKQ